MRHSMTALTSTAAAAALLAGCAADRTSATDMPATQPPATEAPAPETLAPETSGSPAPTTSPSSAEGPTDPHGGVPDFGDGTARQTGDATGRSLLVLTGVRTAAAEGYDRIVLEFSGTDTPGWVVDYVDEPALEGSGEIVDLDGDAALNIFATGTTWPAPDYYSGPARITAPGGAVEDLYVGGTFEGYTQVLAGIDGDRVPFRVFALTKPSRLVVDVADADDRDDRDD